MRIRFFFFNTSFPTAFRNLQNLNISALCAQSQNETPSAKFSPPAYGMSCFTMTIGAISNLTGLGILVKSHTRFRRRAKAPFILLAGTLLITNLIGQVIPGAFALYLHLERHQRQRVTVQVSEPPQTFCNLFGACMVFFGLSPLLLGSAMAVERCIGITRPLLHATVVTMAHVRYTIALLTSVALLLAALPLLDVGSYVPQFPGTWCFLPVHGQLSTASTSLALVFSGLGVAALSLAMLCNVRSGMVLLLGRLATQNERPESVRHHRPAASLSGVHLLDVEMMIQLAVVTTVLCVTWCPFLISILTSVVHFHSASSGPVHHYERQLLLGLRLASWNQILDPWVYILLRRAILRRVCHLMKPDFFSLTRSSSCADSCRQDSGLRLN
uniref:Thromboxane A2 receptor n=1 Tax=Denticeps clupeoides TaxID=299321 RepID=A0AAY4DH31_9TELE